MTSAPLALDAQAQPATVDALMDASRAKVLDMLLLDGAGMQLNVRAAVSDVVLEETMEGSSTLSVQIVDENREILNSALLDHTVDADVLGLEFRLAAVGWQPPMLTLTFEDRAVARLRLKDSPRKTSRGKVTRAEFVYSLVREIRSERIPFYAPELHKRQPIAKVIETPEQKAQRRKTHVDAFPKDAIITVKGQVAKRGQRKVIEDVLQQGVNQGANDRVLVAAIMTITQESSCSNLRCRVISTGATICGTFQQDPRYWPASRNVLKDATAFFSRAIPAFKADPTGDIGDVIDSFQRSGHPEKYDQWEQEARRTVDLWLGSGGKSGTETRKKAYEFARGQSNQPGQTPEDSWTAIQRLSQEVNWRAFMRRGVLYYLSDTTLIGRRATLVVSPTSQGVVSMPFSYNRGKKVQQVTLNIYADNWTGIPGDHVIVNNLGPANGDYLVATARRSLFNPQVEVTLKAATRPLPEPAADTTSVSHSTAALGALSNHILNAYKKAKAISSHHYSYSWGGGHNSSFSPSGPKHAYDCSGSCSAALHAGGMLDAPADTTILANWGAPGPGKFMTLWVKNTGDSHTSHAFLDFNLPGKGLECFTTGNWGAKNDGAGFKPNHHPTDGFTPRHWPGEGDSPTSSPDVPQAVPNLGDIPLLFPMSDRLGTPLGPLIPPSFGG